MSTRPVWSPHPWDAISCRTRGSSTHPYYYLRFGCATTTTHAGARGESDGGGDDAFGERGGGTEDPAALPAVVAAAATPDSLARDVRATAAGGGLQGHHHGRDQFQDAGRQPGMCMPPGATLDRDRFRRGDNRRAEGEKHRTGERGWSGRAAFGVQSNARQPAPGDIVRTCAHTLHTPLHAEAARWALRGDRTAPC